MNNLPFQQSSFKESPLYKFYKDYDVQREFFLSRRKEIEELIFLFQDRVEAERQYA